MTDIAIRCEGLSKRYRIGERESYKALRDVISDAAAAPFRRLRSALANGNGSAQSPLSGTGSSDPHLPIRNPQSTIRNSFWALDDVSFEVTRGEVVGIIGRNGAGKSTLLKILSRVTKPTKGHAEIHGRVGSLLEVGTGFHPELTGRENIYLNGAILGMRKAELVRKFDEIVAFAEVEKFIDTPVKRYSSGMYVRLAFAVAAHLEPEILVIDEVLAVGDAAFQKKCLGKMGEVAHGGRTVLFVSHHMGAIRNLCSEVIWLDDGKVKAHDDAATAVDTYLRTVQHRSGSSIDLTQTKRLSGFGERLLLKSISFNNGGPILHGEPLLVEIEFETKSEIHDAAFGFGFSSFEGTRIMSVDSDLLAPQRQLPKNHAGSVTATIPQLQLQPGQYALDVGARSGNNSAVDYVRGCAQVEVLPGPDTPPLIIRETGGMRIPAEWLWASNGNQEDLPNVVSTLPDNAFN
jgi:homopolymeric O-antigen transport system ATP-binding protein